MNKEVFFKMPIKSRDDTGDTLLEYVFSDKVWAKIEYRSAGSGEDDVTAKKTDIDTVVFTMWYNEAMRTTWRIMHGTKEFEIITIKRHNNLMFMEVKAKRYKAN